MEQLGQLRQSRTRVPSATENTRLLSGSEFVDLSKSQDVKGLNLAVLGTIRRKAISSTLDIGVAPRDDESSLASWYIWLRCHNKEEQKRGEAKIELV